MMSSTATIRLGDYNGQPLAKIQTKIDMTRNIRPSIQSKKFIKFVTDISMSPQLLSVANHFDVCMV